MQQSARFNLFYIIEYWSSEIKRVTWVLSTALLILHQSTWPLWQITLLPIRWQRLATGGHARMQDFFPGLGTLGVLGDGSFPAELRRGTPVGIRSGVKPPCRSWRLTFNSGKNV